MKTEALTARDLAVSALMKGLGGAGREIDRAVEQGSLSRQDLALARELTLGCIRRRGTLRAVLQAFLARPGQRLPSAVSRIFHVGLYQILFLDRVPSFAAVSEAVEQAKRFGQSRQRGLINAVLRAATQEVSEVVREEPPLARDTIPVGPRAYRRSKRPLFPDPAQDPAGYLARAMSLSAALAARWVKQFGSLEGAMGPAMHANVRAPLIVRANQRRADVAQAARSIEKQGVAVQPHVNGASIVVGHELPLTELTAFREGWIQPQDPVATAVGLAAAPEPGIRVLDLCAAPGTKTTHLAELMDDKGEIIAVDARAKLERIRANCQRLGLTIVETLGHDEVRQLDEGSFDLVLVDVPCSNTGVLARRAEVRWRFSETRLPGLVADQQALLAVAERFVRPGGRAVYSTCSLEPEECRQLIDGFLARGSRLRLIRDELSMPRGAEDPREWHDGGYLAILEAGKAN